MGSLIGHLWTLLPHYATRHVAPKLAGQVYQTPIPDVPGRWVRGEYFDAGSDELVVVVHGLGGRGDSAYMVRSVAAAQAMNLSVVAAELRGTATGGGLYHAGAWQDIHAHLQAPMFRRYKTIHIMGWSLGGHIGIRYACAEPDPRLGRVAAICSPLQLKETAEHLDAAPFNPFREHILRGLRDHLAGLGPQPGLPTPKEAQRIKTIRAWDDRVIARSAGYDSAQAYWAGESAAGYLHDLKRPVLYVGGSADPMVPRATVEPALLRGPAMTVRWIPGGGHCGFPPGTTLNGAQPGRGWTGADGALERAVLEWLTDRDN